jgi:hypothetical protein
MGKNWTPQSSSKESKYFLKLIPGRGMFWIEMFCNKMKLSMPPMLKALHLKIMNDGTLCMSSFLLLFSLAYKFLKQKVDGNW